MWISAICPSGLPNQLADFAPLGETVRLILGEDQVIVDDDVEDSLAFREQFGLDAETFLQLGSQTDRLRFVVSLGAIVNFDFHTGSSRTQMVMSQSSAPTP